MALTASQKKKIRQRIGDSSSEKAKNSGLTESEISRIRENFYRNDRKSPTEVDKDYIDTYLKDARNFAFKTGQDYKLLNYKSATAPTTGSYLDTLSNVESDLKSRGRRIQEYLYANRGNMDSKSYESMRTSLDSITGGKSVVGELRRAVDSLSKFESEEDYNQQMKALQDYEAMMAVDTASALSEIEALRRQRDDFEDLRDQYVIAKNNSGAYTQQQRDDIISRYEAFLREYGSVEKLDKEISQKKAYLTQAERLQEGVRLGSVGNKDSENYDEEYDYYANQRSFGIPTAEDLNTYDKMMDQTTWSTDSEGRLFDAYGTEVDPNNRDEQGRIIHPNQNNYDTTDKLGIFLSADAGEIEDAAARYATTGATWDTILGEGKEKNWDQMDEKEISNYYYYLNKFGEEAANNYLSSIQEALNQRKGFERAKAMEDNVALELLFGVEAGFDQFNSGVTGVRNAILGEDDYVPVTSTQFASQKVREDLADADLPAWFNFKTGKFESKILGNSVGQMAYDTVTTTSNMLPSVLASTVIGAVNPAAGAAVGTTLMGASAGGNAYTEMINLGYDVGQAQTYAALVGGSEIVLESILGGVSKLGGGLAAKGATKLLGKADNALAKFAIKFGNTAAGKVLVNALEESSEEFVQSILEPVFRDQIFGTNEGIDIEEALYSALLGAVTGGMFEGGDVASQAMVNSYNTNATGREIIRAEGGVDALKALAMDVAGANTKLTKQAGKVSSEVATGTGFGKVTAAIKNSANQKKVGKLYQAVQQSVSKSNASDIASVLEEKGYDPKSAKNIAEAVVAQMDGKELDAFQEGTLKAYAGDTKIDQAVEQLMNDTESAFAKRTGNMDTFNIGIAFGKGIAPTATQEVKSADIKVSDDGKTKVSGGREIPIKFSDNGQIATDNGAVIKVDDVEFSSNREGYVVEAISNLRLPANAANKLFDSIDLKNMTDAQAVEFVTGIQKAYELGRENNLTELPTHPLTKNLTSEQRMEAYSAGLGVRNKETAARQKAATETKQKAEKAERKPGVYFVSDDQQIGDIDSFLENSSGLSGQQTSGIDAMKHLSKAIGVEFYVFKSYDKDGKRYYIDENGVEKPAPNGWYDTATGKIYIDLYAGQTARGTMLFTIAHELTHFIRQNSPAKFDALADIVVNKSNLKGKVSARIEQKLREAKDRGESISRDTAYEEVIADSMETILTSGRVFELMNEIQQQDKTLWEQIRDWFMDFIKSIREAYSVVDADTVEGQAVAEVEDVLKELEQVFAEGLLDAGGNFKTAEDLDISIDTKTESVAPSVLKSERTWKESDYVQERDKAAAEIAKAIGVTEQKAKDYIDSVNSIAKMIADDRVRLDYFSSPGRSSFVSNVEYGGSFDFSTLCKKRRLLTGTFTAIQKALPNTALTANEILEIRNRMKEANLEVSCGLCYVEGSRANMGQFAKEFLRLYKQYYPDGWQPNMADVNTPDGIEWVRINHPEVYEQYEYFWNHYGTLKPGDKNLFASQQKPKLYQLHTEYKGEILQKFNDDDNVEEKNLNGGIRLQSFSDFEIVHLIDTMQIIMDMSRVGLAGQAYTKVPDFAWALGDTGLKINLSLIAKGVDENGKLIFDDIEGMPIAEAMKLRDRYSKNVGTILVAFNDEQLMAAMADERVDFIIPFHRSQWKKSQYAAMGLPAKTKDYTFMQNEKFIKPQYHEYRGRMVKDKATNYMPNEYWDFSKTGKQNAEAYLEMCARNNKRPKFYKLLQNNGDGSYSLKADGSTDGYWKLLIDFKMYDNDGIGSPQASVKPEFNMDEAMRMLNDYKGGHSNFPVAQGIVDSFVEEYKTNHPDKLYSNRTTESLSTRPILTNALEGVAQNEWEQNKLNEYKENIAKVEEMESRLQEINSQLYPYGKKMPQKERIALQDEAVGLRNEITNIDKNLLRLEATKPLQNVLNRERARVRREMKQKAEERISEVKAEAAQRLKRRSEGHAATEMRKKIRKTIRELDKILNRGDKKRNVKEDMKDFVTKATQSAELLFKESYPNEDILREGFQRVNLRPSEQVHYDEARKILEQIQTLGTSYDTIDEVTKLRGKLDYRISKLREAFDQERMLLNETEVAEVLNNLAGAYADLKNSEYSYIVEAYNEHVHEHLASLAEGMGGATIRSMTMAQLEDLYKAYRMVLETVRNSNKVFNEDIKLTRQQVSEEVIREILAQKKRDPLWSKAEISRNKFFWNNLKPIYATERVGSQTFSKVMNGLFEGQYKWATNVEAARNFQREISRKYKANGWDMNTSYAFTSSSGLDFELNLGQILSLYAYSKRAAAHDHITHGGIVFDKNTEVKIKENGIPVTRLKREATTYSISDEILGEILSKLTPEQKLFVDDMQKYLSETMGGLGNEVSMKLYGVKLFGEENYFPLKSAGEYNEKAKEADIKKAQGHTSIVNAGFTHAVKPKATNPIIINSFMDVWANHVNDMAMYNGMVLPMEDFRKVYNFHTPFYEGSSAASVQAALANAFGSEATTYFLQLYQELNSGAVTDPRESLMQKWVSKFKKASVMMSMSVVMQQPSAIGRAFALVDPKYFVGEKISENEQTKQWDELKKYAPVAIIKEMGGFDTHMGTGAKDYLLSKEYSKEEIKDALLKDKQYRKETWDMISGYLPAKADEITWVAIWQAVKRETKATNPHLAGEEFFKKAGRRFSEVIEKTQVYDSVLARSANMRSKTIHMTMATAFMAEPTTTINMVELALRSKKNVGRVLASVVTSIVINNFLASWIYAARDDDEDETFLEKYAQAFTSGLVDDLNPITYYPFVKDIWSLFQGYDVERGDMSVIADVSDALKKAIYLIRKDTSEMNEEQLAKHHAQTWDAILTLADGVASVCGIPSKNVRREVSAGINTVKTLTNGLGFSGTSLANAIGDSALDALPVANYLWMPDKADRLYTAIKNGDTDYVNRLKQEYGDDTKVSKAIQKGLKENDPRIYEAALKDIAGLPAERLKLQKEVMADGFSWEDVRNATVSIINKLTPDAAKAAPKKHGYYETDDFVTFVAKGQTSYANEAKKDIITTHQLNGKTEEEAIRSFKSSVSSQMKNAFNDGRVSASVAIHALVTYGEMDNTDATNKVESWKFEKEYGFQYGDRADAYKAGEISASELKKALTTVGGKTPAEADMQIKVYDWQKAGIDIDNDQTGIIKRYEEFCEAEGIDKRTYADFYKFYQESGEEGVAYSKTIECMPYIDSLSLSNKQKNALALSIWGESTVKKYKLW